MNPNELLAKIKKQNKLNLSPELDNKGKRLIVSHGVVKTEKRDIPVDTALSIRSRHSSDTVIEFSTHIGQLPQSSFSDAILNELNHSFEGKFVTFDANDDAKSDVVYTTLKPTEWALKGKRVEAEIEAHAETKALTQPILEEVDKPGKSLIKSHFQAKSTAFLTVKAKLLLADIHKPPSFEVDNKD